jgi:hypothetical protein
MSDIDQSHPTAGHLRKRYPLLQATPDGLVIIHFSSHACANKRRCFYLLPSDLGKADLSEDKSKNAAIPSGFIRSE